MRLVASYNMGFISQELEGETVAAARVVEDVVVVGKWRMRLYNRGRERRGKPRRLSSSGLHF